jgi:hypothetical protein
MAFNAVVEWVSVRGRLPLRRPTHGEPDARAFHRLLQTAVGLKAKDYAPKGRGAMDADVASGR